MLFAAAKNAEELDSDDTDDVTLFKNKSYNDHMCVGIGSNMLKMRVKVFDSGTWPILFRVSFPERHVVDGAHPSRLSPVCLEQSRQRCRQIYALCAARRSTWTVSFSVMENLSVSLLLWPSFTDSFVKRLVRMEQQIILVQSRSARHYFRTHTHVWPPGCTSEWSRRW